MAAKNTTPKPDPNAGVIAEIKSYGLDPETYYVETTKQVPVIRNGRPVIVNGKPLTQKVIGKTYNIEQAKADYQFNLPKLQDSSAETFTQAVNNYYAAVAKVGQIGAENLNEKDKATLRSLGRTIRDFDSPSLGGNAKQIIQNTNDVENAINEIYNQADTVRVQELRSAGLSPDGKPVKGITGEEKKIARQNLVNEQNTLRRLVNTSNQAIPRLQESLTRYGLGDILNLAGATQTLSKLGTGLEALRGDRIFGTGALTGKLSSQLTDEQIISDINTARRNEYKRLADLGTAAVTDLQSQITQAKTVAAGLTGKQKTDADSSIANLEKQLAQAKKDQAEASNLFQNYTPVSGDQATTSISQFRESLRLPEQRTLDQIRLIDPNLFNTIQGLSKQYGELAAQPIGPTTSPETEAFRRDVEQRIAGQVALGSQLGAEEQRQYQQAARAAQTARGNIFGVAPAVEEAVTTGAAGEQRLAARLGAAQGFLSSGQTVSDALARDVGLRNALQQSRLGAAAEFAASGPSMYNMASQRAAQQQGVLQNYLAASQPTQTQGFQATQSQFNPYAYVNPNAGLLGAQNAAGIYNTLADYQAQTYGAQASALASGYRSPAQQIGSVLSGVSGFAGLFGGPGSNAFFRA
jgi:hypothetical protein